MTYLKEIESAGHKATAKGGAFYPRTDAMAEKIGIDSKAQYFLENWDSERLSFKSHLFLAGFKTEWSKAPYHWRMHKKYSDGSIVEVTYVEGDVYVKVIPSQK